LAEDDERTIARLARYRNRQRWPSAFAGMMLADNGADVFRIDRSGHLRLFGGRHSDAARSVVQGSMADRTRVKLYFDKTSGLLVRQTRYAPTAVGTVPTHVVYSDYRPLPDVGVKLPFNWQVTWVDG